MIRHAKYKSPIKQINNDYIDFIVKKNEEEIMYSVSCSVGYEVDKEELIKALEYDRGQYLKGYKDGVLNAINEFKSYIESGSEE